MWQRFTERARRVILLAQEEAAQQNSGSVGSGALLLGLLREEQGVGAQVLARLGINYGRVRAELPLAPSPISHSDGPKLTPEAKRVLELAAEEARRMHHNYIGSEHLLLGLLHENGDASAILRQFDLDLDTTRQRVAEYLGLASLSTSQVASEQPTVPQTSTASQRFMAAQTAAQQVRIQQMARELEDWRATAKMFKMIIQETERTWALEEGVSERSEDPVHEPNLDFSNLKEVMQDANTALIVTGAGSGERRASDAAQAIISAPLFQQIVMGARKILVSVSGDDDLAIGEVEEIVRALREAADVEEANVSWGVVFKPELQGSINVTVVATGFDHPESSL